MPIECPVCRSAITWYRLLVTTAWGRWRCRGCGSLLGINVRRRLLTVGAFVALVLALIGLRELTGWRYLDRIGTLAFLAGWALYFVVYFLFFERPVVYERVGLRCRQCGYDLRGQTDPRCPECGRELDATEKAQLGLPDAGALVQRGRGQSRAVRIWVLVVVVALTLQVLLGVFFWVRLSRARRAVVPDTSTILQAALAFAHDHAGRGPRHAIELAADDYLAPFDFVAAFSSTREASVPIADITLSKFANLSSERKQAVAQAAVDALPEATIAHRLGDFVLTHHGIDLANADPDLWIVVRAPDPDQNPPPQPQDVISIGLAGGRTIRVRLAKLVEALSKQNAVRAKHNLPPLPDPFNVTHAGPAVAKP